MTEERRKQVVKDLTLMLAHLTSWKESAEYDWSSAWKTYDWDAIDALCEEQLFYMHRMKNKSVIITKEGEARAKQLLKEYGID